MEQSRRAKNGNEKSCLNSAPVVVLLPTVNDCVRNTVLRRKGTFKNHSHHVEGPFKIKFTCDNQKVLAGCTFHSIKGCVRVHNHSISKMRMKKRKFLIF